MNATVLGFHLARRAGLLASACLFVLPTARADLPSWFAHYDLPGAIQNSNQFTEFHSDDFSRGFVWSSTLMRISGFSGVNMPSTVVFDNEGALEWAAFLELPSGGSGRLFPLEDLHSVFAGYRILESVTERQGFVGVLDGATLEQRFGFTFPFQTFLNISTSIALYPGNVAGVVQSLEDAAHVMLLDENGTKTLDRIFEFDFSGLPFPVTLTGFNLFRLPDLSGFLLEFPPLLMRFDNDGTVRWNKLSGEFSNMIVTAEGEVVSLQTVPGEFFNPPVEGMVTRVQKFNIDGEREWVTQIEDFIPDSGFEFGSTQRLNPFSDGETLWVTGHSSDQAGQSPPYDGAEDLLVFRLDAASGALLAQTEISIEGEHSLRGALGGWTGQHGVLSLHSDRPIEEPVSGILPKAYLLKLDSDLDGVDAFLLRGDIGGEVSRISHDPEAGAFLYASRQQLFANDMSAVILDEALNPVTPCDILFDAAVTLTSGSRVVTSLDSFPQPNDVPVSTSEANTELTPAEIPITPLFVESNELCPNGIPPPSALSYADWAVETFGPGQAANPAVSGPGVDLTGDGLTNLHAYALGLNPLEHNSPVAGAVVSDTGSGVFLTFQRRENLGDYRVVVEGSLDLERWDEPVVEEIVSVDPDGIGTVIARLAAVPEAANGFLRIRILEK